MTKILPVAAASLDEMAAQKLMKLDQKQRVITWGELKEHCTEVSPWVAIDGNVYDVTKLSENHPGGKKVLLTMAGRDASDVFNEFHPIKVRKIIPKYFIGKLDVDSRNNFNKVERNASESLDKRRVDTVRIGLDDEEKKSDSGGSDEGQNGDEPSEKQQPKMRITDSTTDEIMKDYYKVRKTLEDMNLFETDLSYYYIKMGLLAVNFLLVLWLVLSFDTLLAHFLGACLLGMFWQQFAFVGHDTGHNAITHNRKKDLIFGVLLCEFFGGISVGWWKMSHNVHHINCNSINEDPDIQHLPVFAVAEKMVNDGGFKSNYHRRIFQFDRLARFLVSKQHFLFYPVMMFARFNLYLQSWIAFFKAPKEELELEYRNLEMAACVGFAIWNVLLANCVPGSTNKVVFILVSHAVSGILHVQICLSHFTMQTYEGNFNKFKSLVAMDSKTNEVQENWVLLQLLTSMNVSNPQWLDFFHGGLNFQIEHHLFPRLPRHNLRIASYFVKRLCEKHGIPYRAPSFYDANVELVQRLRATALEVNKNSGLKTFYESQLYDGLNCIG